MKTIKISNTLRTWFEITNVVGVDFSIQTIDYSESPSGTPCPWWILITLGLIWSFPHWHLWADVMDGHQFINDNDNNP